MVAAAARCFGFQFRGIEHRDQVSLFYLCAFIHQQLWQSGPDICGLTMTWLESTVPISTRSLERGVEIR